MIDLHCHILVGIDGQPFDMQRSIDMARIAAEDGIEEQSLLPPIIKIFYIQLSSFVWVLPS